MFGLKLAGKTGTKKKAKIEVPVEPAKQIDHVLVPDVEQSPEEDLKFLAEKHGVTRDKLPLINSLDPAIGFLQLKPGDVVKFHRKSLVTGKESPYYRLVVGA